MVTPIARFVTGRPSDIVSTAISGVGLAVLGVIFCSLVIQLIGVV